MKRLIVLLISLALAATACSQGNVFSLAVGDCFNNSTTSGEISSVEMVDCAESHDNEVYATFEVPGSTYPGQTAVQLDADNGCYDRFEGYVDRDYESSAFGFSHLTPTSASWDQGDREVVCILFDFTGGKLTTSAKGTGL